MNQTRDERTEPKRTQRAVWWAIALGAGLVLLLSALLEPDARGYGTHTQLGLPPCGFSMITGAPCPGCGLTTAFAHAIRGQWILAAEANPLGLFLFVVTGLCLPTAIAAVLRCWSIEDVYARFAIGRWALAIACCGAALWVARMASAI